MSVCHGPVCVSGPYGGEWDSSARANQGGSSTAVASTGDQEAGASLLGPDWVLWKFIPQYASIAAPLTDLTKKFAPTSVVWTAECDIAFKKLKSLLCSSPVLYSPDFGEEFMLQTDASDRGVGAVLSQIRSDGGEHPIAYYSRKLLPREERYSTVEKECLAVKLGIQAFCAYLLGRPFRIQTDHRSLVWLDRLKESNTRLDRWSLPLQP